MAKSPMIPVFLTRVKTRDNIVLDGIYVKPSRKSKTALLWLHGLSSKFYSGQILIQELSKRCAASGIGYFKFNTRGHDIATREPAVKSGFGGTAFERFEDCLLDIRAIIRLAKKLGYKNIILAGHSTGANKILYYFYKTRDRSIRGLILIGPVSDVSAETKKIGPRRLKKALAIAKRLKSRSPLSLMPRKYGIWTARRYWSLYHAGEQEDVFPYYNPRRRWKALATARIPIAVIIGSRDEHLDPVRSKSPKATADAPVAYRTSNWVDRPAQNLLEIFRAKARLSKSFSGTIIKGAKHSFIKREKELSRAVINFINRAIA